MREKHNERSRKCNYPGIVYGDTIALVFHSSSFWNFRPMLSMVFHDHGPRVGKTKEEAGSKIRGIDSRRNGIFGELPSLE
jgi:hypothetical protein